MAIEIERKYLLKNEDWKQETESNSIIKQGFLNSNPDRTVRVRITNNKGYLTIKSRNKGSVRKEFEYVIPILEAEELISLCEKPIIEKTRFIVKIENHTWEIDVFDGENKGLIVAEIELSHEDESFTIPNWVGKDITNETKYYNSQLINHPYSVWKK